MASFDPWLSQGWPNFTPLLGRADRPLIFPPDTPSSGSLRERSFERCIGSSTAWSIPPDYPYRADTRRMLGGGRFLNSHRVLQPPRPTMPHWLIYTDYAANPPHPSRAFGPRKPPAR